MDAADAKEPLKSQARAKIARQRARELYGQVPLPDKRLNRRLETMHFHMAQKPTDSLTQAFDHPGDVKGAYRLIENDRIEPFHLTRAFALRAVREAEGRPVVLSVQDSSSLSFPRAKATKGLGPVTNNDTQGLMMHTAMLLSEEGMPLELITQDVWARPQEKKKESKSKRAPMEEKESFKWLKSMREQRRFFQEISAEKRPKLIHLFDREGDIHELIQDILDHQEGCVIRSCQNRRASDEDGALCKAHDQVAASEKLGEITVKVKRRGDRPARKALVEIRSIRLTLEPSNAYPHRKPLQIALVEARETDPPEDGGSPIHWRLLTTEPAHDFAKARKIVQHYSRRWLIEEYHLILKSGCRLEDLRFHTAQRIAKVLAIYGPAALLILQLREFGRLEPEASCAKILDETAWRVLYTVIHKKPPLPQTPPPTIKQALLWIGRLGGHLGRKGDGMPGVRTLWRGWRDLSQLVAHARLFAQIPPSQS